MNIILIRSLVAAAGGFSGFLFGLWRRRFREGKYIRKGLVEVLGAAVAGSLLDWLGPPAQLVMAFAAGLAWSLLCQQFRAWLTAGIERDLTALQRWWPKYSQHQGDTLQADRRLAVSWPATFWSKVFHRVGLSDLSDARLAAYERYRAKLAWDILPSDRFRRRRTNPKRPPWWRTRRGLPFAGIALAGTLAYVLVLVSNPNYPHLRYEHLIQLLVILLLFLLCPDPRVDENKEPDETEAARCFARQWYAFQASWVLLYGLFFLGATFPAGPPLGFPPAPPGRRAPVWELATHFASNLNTYFLVMCFLILHDPPTISSRRRPLAARVWALGLALVAALTAAEACCHFLDGEHSNVWIDRINWVAGFAGGVALALLVGRLESDFIKPPIWLIAALYFYSVIQGAHGTFRTTVRMERLLLSLALPLKCLLLMLVAWFLESDRLLSYMRAVRGLQMEEELPDGAPGKPG
jgi:hypothetical protein